MSRTTKLVPLAVLAATAVVTAACGGSGGKPAAASGAGAPTTATTPAAPAGGGAVVATASSPLGQLLVDSAGRTLYLFEADRSTASTCNDACTQAWPPLLTTGPPTAGTGANAAELGTTTRKDGKVEVTYHGHPLYHYVADTAAGDTNGQGLNQFGAKWYVLAPSGTKIDND
jgi:predicted lipoprotein with Yx(FWY)xxD motif